MHKFISSLLQIQNLELTIHENASILKLKKDDHIYRNIISRIEELKKDIPNEIVSNYELISKSYDVAVTPILNNTCTGCFMKLSIGEVQQVKTKVFTCSHCNRFLYFEEDASRPEYNTEYQGIGRFSSPKLMFPAIKDGLKDKYDVIRKMGKNICKAKRIKKADEFIDTLIQREKLLSTAIGKGIAFPHARGSFVSGLLFAVGIVRDGIDFGEDETVQLLVTFSVPTNVNKFYLGLASKLAKHFGNQKRMDKMLKCETPEEMWKIISRIAN